MAGRAFRRWLRPRATRDASVHLLLDRLRWFQRAAHCKSHRPRVGEGHCTKILRAYRCQGTFLQVLRLPRDPPSRTPRWIARKDLHCCKVWMFTRSTPKMMGIHWRYIRLIPTLMVTKTSKQMSERPCCCCTGGRGAPSRCIISWAGEHPRRGARTDRSSRPFTIPAG